VYNYIGYQQLDLSGSIARFGLKLPSDSSALAQSQINRSTLCVSHAGVVAQGNVVRVMNAFDEKMRFSGTRWPEIPRPIKITFCLIDDVRNTSRQDKIYGDHPSGCAPSI
jgi:hypothetical protein